MPCMAWRTASSEPGLALMVATTLMPMAAPDGSAVVPSNVDSPPGDGNGSAWSRWTPVAPGLVADSV